MPENTITNTVNAIIKLRTNEPTEALKKGEIYLKTETDEQTNISYLKIYVGDGSSNLTTLTPFILRVNGNSLEPETMGGFTNNGDSIGGGTISSATIEKMIADIDGGDIVGTKFPDSATEGQIFFKVN